MILNRLELQSKLAILGKAYQNKTPIPVYQFVKFDDDRLIMSDGNINIVCMYNVGIKVLLPFKQLNDIINKVKTDNIELIIEEKNAILKSGRSKFTLNIGLFSDYPDIRLVDNKETIVIKSNDFLKTIKGINYCCSRDEKKPILTGVNFSEDKAIATDSFRLAQCNINLGLNCTINHSDLDNLTSIINDDVEIKITNNNNMACFEFNNIIYQTRLLDGKFPDASKIINNDYPIKVNVNRIELIEALEKANLVNDIDNNVVILDIKNDNILITNYRSQFGKFEEDIKCKSNDNLIIGCDSYYLIETLNKINNNDITLEFQNNVRPFIIKEENLTHLILPVKVE